MLPRNDIVKIITVFGKEVLNASILGRHKAVDQMERILDRYFVGGNIVEIGTYCGISAALLAQYADHVYTFDISPRCFVERGTEGEKEALLTTSRPEDVCKSIWKELGLQDKITDIIIPRDTSPDLSDIDFSFAFVDGDHTTEGITRDFEAVRHCGKVLFHDYPNIAAVKTFVNQLEGETVVDPPLALWVKK